jgi:hypothetical protein
MYWASQVAGLKLIPGIGDYTAGAIASIAFGEQVLFDTTFCVASQFFFSLF